MLTEEQIEIDLRAFADPGSDILIVDGEMMWEQDAVERRIRLFVNQDGNLAVEHEGLRLSYRQFLASEGMANLRHLAQFMTKTIRQPDHYIATEASLVTAEVAETSNAHTVDLIRERATRDLPPFSTRVVFVQGEAGAGKTVSLRKLTSDQASRYLHGSTNALFFYVDAQGRALSRLEDAISKELDDLRAKFTYEAVAPLTRHGLLVPIIDGFDELLGSGGYDDAFSSLAAFIATLNGSGSVIASARSSFFDYTDFRQSAARYAQDGLLNYSVETLSVRAWDSARVREYFVQVGADHGVVQAEMHKSLDSFESTWSEADLKLLRKPFYAARIADLAAQGVRFDRRDLLSQLVSAFLEREVDKLKDRDGTPLLDLEGHRSFVESLAEEMWWLENRRLDVASVQVFAEIIAEERQLPPSVARALIEKVSSYAFLSAEGPKRLLGFEHEVFYGYFLAQRLAHYVKIGGPDLRRFLSRSVMDEPLIDEAGRLVSRSKTIATAIANICGATTPAIADSIPRENAGALVASTLRHADEVPAGLDFTNLVFRGVSLANVELVSPTFINCDFQEVDLTGAKFRRLSLTKSVIRDAKVDPAITRLEGATLAVGETVTGLLVLEKERGHYVRVYEPDRIASALLQMGAIVPGIETSTAYDAPARERVEALERLTLIFQRHFYLPPSELEQKISGRPEWRAVMKLLEHHQLLEETYIQKSGPKTPFLRLRIAPEVLRRGENLSDPTVPSEVRAFWKDLVTKSN